MHVSSTVAQGGCKYHNGDEHQLASVDRRGNVALFGLLWNLVGEISCVNVWTEAHLEVPKNSPSTQGSALSFSVGSRSWGSRVNYSPAQ